MAGEYPTPSPPFCSADDTFFLLYTHPCLLLHMHTYTLAQSTPNMDIAQSNDAPSYRGQSGTTDLQASSPAVGEGGREGGWEGERSEEASSDPSIPKASPQLSSVRTPAEDPPRLLLTSFIGAGSPHCSRIGRLAFPPSKSF